MRNISNPFAQAFEQHYDLQGPQAYPVNAQNIQDPDLYNVVEEINYNEHQNYVEMQPLQMDIKSNGGRHKNVTENDVNNTAKATI